MKKVKVHEGQLQYESYIRNITAEVDKLNTIYGMFTEILKDTKIQVTDTIVFGGKSRLESEIASFIAKEPKHYQGHLEKYYAHAVMLVNIPTLNLQRFELKEPEYRDLKQFIVFKDGLFSVDIDAIDKDAFSTYIDEDLYNQFAALIENHNLLCDRFGNITDEIVAALRVPFHESNKLDCRKSLDKVGLVLRHVSL